LATFYPLIGPQIKGIRVNTRSQLALEHVEKTCIIFVAVADEYLFAHGAQSLVGAGLTLDLSPLLGTERSFAIRDTHAAVTAITELLISGRG
jgi:hypothetical protein